MAFDKLRDFVGDNLKEVGEKIIGETGGRGGENRKAITYEDWGFEAAGKANGLEMPFRGMLNLVREHFRKEAHEDEQERQKTVSEAKANLQKRELQIKQKESDIKRVEAERITPLRQKIIDLKKDIARIRANPGELLEDWSGKAGLVIGILILSALTVYLFIFYSSASFSAFFKEFTPNDMGMAGSIFDPRAIESAYGDGVTEAILILTIPFVFIGLGYLIHRYVEDKSWESYLKVAGLMAITFVFDGILAYEITKKMYNIHKEGLLEGSMPDYTVAMAFQSVNFWLIIFAGFVVYIVWGLVFAFVMESNDRFHRLKQAIRVQETEIKLCEQDIKRCEADIQTLRGEMAALELERTDFEKIANGDTVILNWEGYRKKVFEFASGWEHWMSANKKTEEEVNKMHLVVVEFVDRDWQKYRTEKTIDLTK